MLPEIDVIGGKADGHKIRTAAKIVVSLKLAGDDYIAIAIDIPGQGRRQTVIYMLAGMQPAEAMKIWRDRHAKAARTAQG